MRIGIDVGGTNTDAVLMDGRQVIASTKQVTSSDVTGGVLKALDAVLQESRTGSQDVDSVMIGTTHFTNAVVQRQGLDRTGVVRLGYPATLSIPPLEDWPDDLRGAIGGVGHIAHGGHQFDGREISPIDENELRRIADELGSGGVTSVVISGVFSPAVQDHETRAADLVQSLMPQAAITRSHQIGRLGLLERENAAAMNACLASMASRTIAAFEAALEQQGITAPLYLSQNDGTLMTAAFTKQYPVLTFASGPTNSMRGAATLSDVSTGIVIDIGGTTTDGGVLVNGFPREASFEVEIGGVRTNFRMPDVISIGLGGGSYVSDDGTRVGPQSSGYRLTTEAKLFGGEHLTASDVAVAAGRATFGDPTRVGRLGEGLVRQACKTIDERVEELVDSLKTSPEDLPLIVVGGGSILVGEAIQGASRVIRPEHAGVANAIGAAIAQVSGEVDRIFSLEDRTRDSALGEARDAAIKAAVSAGADSETVEIVEIDEIPLAYLPSNALRIRIKAVGDLKG